MRQPWLALLALATVSAKKAPPEAGPLCWEMRDGYNAVARMVKAPKTEKRPDVFYFGEADSMEACRTACEREDECSAFTWMGPAPSGSSAWLNVQQNKWARQCYGRSKQSMTMVPEKGRTSGRKIPCAQLEELEKSFGVDPARLQRSKEASMNAAQEPPPQPVHGADDEMGEAPEKRPASFGGGMGGGMGGSMGAMGGMGGLGGMGGGMGGGMDSLGCSMGGGIGGIIPIMNPMNPRGMFSAPPPARAKPDPFASLGWENASERS